MPLPTLRLSGKQHHRVMRGHVWAYRDELVVPVPPPDPGEVVELLTPQGRFCAIGSWNPRSQIALRILSRQPRAIDDAFWRERLDAALALRERTMPGAEACRLVSSEGDSLPGLIVDRYGDHVVVQFTTLGMERQREAILRVLTERLAPRALVERSDAPARALEGLEARKGIIAGNSDGTVTVTIGDARVACDLMDPHKTGSYLDQQLNHRAVAGYVRSGGRVLDAFCHLGGFGVHAALAGAREVIGLDIAERSIAGAGASAALSGVGARCSWQSANAFDELKLRSAAGERYDLIVLDPPAFARARVAVAGALRGYRELHVRALRMLPVGGVLATFTCSHHVDAATFLDTIVAAANDAHVTLRLDRRLAASPDHPLLPAVPETEYLKGFVLTVVEAGPRTQEAGPKSG